MSKGKEGAFMADIPLAIGVREVWRYCSFRSALIPSSFIQQQTMKVFVLNVGAGVSC